MSDKATQFEVTIKVTAPTEQLVTDYCITHLRDRGYSVRAPRDGWETPTEFCKRVGIHYETFRRATLAPDCPPVKVKKGRTGRLISLQSNDIFEEFVTRNKS